MGSWRYLEPWQSILSGADEVPENWMLCLYLRRAGRDKPGNYMTVNFICISGGNVTGRDREVQDLFAFEKARTD